MKLVELQAIALQHKDNCPGNSGYEMCDDNDYRCCPKDLPVCCTIGLKPWEFCCPNNYTCCGEGYCCGGHDNSTTIEPVTQKTPLPDMYRNRCQQFWVGGCPSAPNDDGFLGIINSTDPAHCRLICMNTPHIKCNSIVFQPYDLQNPDGKGICEMWSHTVEEYHAKCAWHSGDIDAYEECKSLRQQEDNYRPCNVNLCTTP